MESLIADLNIADDKKNVHYRYPGQHRRSFISQKSVLLEIYQLCISDKREYFQWIGLRGFSHLLYICNSWIGDDIVPLVHSLLMEYDALCVCTGAESSSLQRPSSGVSATSQSSSKGNHGRIHSRQLHACRTFIDPEDQNRLSEEIFDLFSEILKALPRLEGKFGQLSLPRITN